MFKLLLILGLAYYLLLLIKYTISVKVKGYDKLEIIEKINKDGLFYDSD